MCFSDILINGVLRLVCVQILLILIAWILVMRHPEEVISFF